MEWLWWVLGICFFGGVICEIYEKVKEISWSKHREEYNRIYNEIDYMDLSELQDLESQLSDYATCILWSFRHPEWKLKDYKEEKRRKIKGGPICGCATYGEASEMYQKISIRIMKMK